MRMRIDVTKNVSFGNYLPLIGNVEIEFRPANIYSLPGNRVGHECLTIF